MGRCPCGNRCKWGVTTCPDCELDPPVHRLSECKRCHKAHRYPGHYCSFRCEKFDNQDDIYLSDCVRIRCRSCDCGCYQTPSGYCDPCREAHGIPAPCPDPDCKPIPQVQGAPSKETCACGGRPENHVKYGAHCRWPGVEERARKMKDRRNRER